MATEEETVSKMLADPWWRLCNLYHIKSEETGQIIPFRPYPEQMDVFRAVLVDRHHSIIIPKARRRGMSTGIDILGLDLGIVNAGHEMGIVDRTAGDATKKLKNICGVSVDKLPPFLKESLKKTKDNDDQLSLRVDEDAESHIYASTGYRGGNCNFLHVSEWGWVQCEDPKRSEEIQTGAIQAARKGVKIVETTWKGGKHGHLWNYVEQAQSTPEEEKHSRSWRIMFFPWHTDPFYSLDSQLKIRPECEDYFRELAFVNGIKLNIGQKRWYQEEAWPLGNNRFGEYPSTLEECFLSPMEGVIYDVEMSRMLAEKRITTIPLEPGLKVFIAFDLGRNDAMPFGVFQVVGKEIRLLKYYVTHREAMRHYGEVIKAWAADNKVPIHDIEILLPHDGGRKSLESGKTLQEVMVEMGFNCRVIPKIPRVWTGINYVKDTFPYLYFDRRAMVERHQRGKKKFPTFGESMSNYHQAETMTGKTMSLEPVHDSFSHACLHGSVEITMAGGGTKPIRDITPGEMVDTPVGPCRVLDCRATGYKPVREIAPGLWATRDHKIFTMEGLTRADTLGVLAIGWCSTRFAAANSGTGGLLRALLEDRASSAGQSLSTEQKATMGDIVPNLAVTPLSWPSREKEEFAVVFDITVDVAHCYYAAGVLVSNCDMLRTFCEGWQRGSISRDAARDSTPDGDTHGDKTQLAGRWR